MDYRTEVYAPATTLEVIASLRSALGQVMRIENHTIHEAPVELIEFTGALTRPSDEAFDHIYARFIEVGYTPMLSQRDGKEIVVARHGIVQPTPSKISTNVILLVLTIISTWLVGLQIGGGDQLAAAVDRAGGDLFRALSSDPSLILSGLPYVLTLLGILGVHEMGHYVAARLHKAAVTLPYFIPMPFGLGTMGAVIRLKSPIKNRRQLFDIGVAGPLAGLAIAIPLLIVGLLMSPVQHVNPAAGSFQEGNSILYAVLKFITKGQWLPGNGQDVFINDIAFPAWFGLIVTMINLLPIGQLDGGHVIYSLFGARAVARGDGGDLRSDRPGSVSGSDDRRVVERVAVVGIVGTGLWLAASAAARRRHAARSEAQTHRVRNDCHFRAHLYPHSVFLAMAHV